jgi:hypothetical protein
MVVLSVDRANAYCSGLVLWPHWLITAAAGGGDDQEHRNAVPKL